MFDLKAVNWLRLKEANDLFKPFVPDPKDPIDFQRKLIKFMTYLRDRFLYLGDEFRQPELIRRITENFLYGAHFNIFYEMGDFQGLVGFTKIVPGFKAGVLYKIWDKAIWGKDTLRKMIDLADMFTEEFQLQRLYLDTPDRHMVKMARLVGFKLEGESPKDFMWNKKLYTTYHLGRIKDDEKKESIPKQTDEKIKIPIEKKSKKTTKTVKKGTKKTVKKKDSKVTK